MSFFNRQHIPKNKPQISPEQFIVQPYEIATAVKQDNCYLLRWRVQAKRVNVYSGTSPDNIQRSQPIVCVSRQQEAIVPEAGAVRPYFELEFLGGEYDQHRVLIAERFLPHTGALNFRDAGGYITDDGHQVKWGMLYRSGLLGNLNPVNHVALTQLGIRLVADIRSKDEMVRLPDELGKMNGIEHHEWPLESVERLSHMRAAWTVLFRRYQLSHWMQHGYTQTIVEDNPHVIGTLFRHLADERNVPAIVHCMAGKDRTGVVIAMLLRVLGVPEDVVIADYTLSNYYFTQFQQALMPQIRPFLKLGVKLDELWPLFVADSNRLRNTLHHICEKYDSIETYLEQRGGVDQTTIVQLRHNLRMPISTEGGAK